MTSSVETTTKVEIDSPTKTETIAEPEEISNLESIDPWSLNASNTRTNINMNNSRLGGVILTDYYFNMVTNGALRIDDVPLDIREDVETFSIFGLTLITLVFETVDCREESK